MQLADEGRFGVSPSCTLPPGNSHKTRQVLAFRALRQQHAAIGIDQGDGDHQQHLQRVAHAARPVLRSQSLRFRRRRMTGRWQFCAREWTSPVPQIDEADLLQHSVRGVIDRDGGGDQFRQREILEGEAHQAAGAPPEA